MGTVMGVGVGVGVCGGSSW